MNIFDLCIIGAGPAGLRAAKHAIQHGLTVILIEARDRVGGRTWTKTFQIDGKSVDIDLGGQWIGPTQYNVHQLVREYGLKTRAQFDDGKNVLHISNEKHIYQGNISELTMFASLEKNQKAEIDVMWEKLDKMANTIKDVGRPFDAPNARKWDTITFAEWVKENVKLESTRKLLNWFVGVCLAVDPSEISFLYFLLFLRAGGGYEKLVNIHGGAQQDLIQEGAQSISKKMAEEINASFGSRILLNSRCTSIKQDQNGVTIIYEKNTRQYTVRSKYCIIAMSPFLCNRIRFSPELPSLRDSLGQKMPPGSVIKVHVAYKRPWWRNSGYSGELISDSEPLSLTYDKCYSGMYALVGFIAGSNARKWGEKSEETRKKAVIQQLYNIFQKEEALNPIFYVDYDWSKEEFSRGCYFSVMGPTALTDCGEYLRKPFGRIHWAGTETANVWVGYIDGALESGIRAADEVIKRIKKSKL